MARFNPYEQYNEVSFGTSDPGKLVVSTYNAAIRAVKEAARSIRENDYESRTRSFDLAFGLISELRKSLNPEAGGEIAMRLESLYTFFTREILTANVNSDAERLEPVIRIMTDLRDTWEKVRKEAITT